ncbi:lipid A export ATP-binding/permease protein MsbA [Dokdonia sp. MED134]|uniref:ABC transporter ATP-binding protein n=1 Tax=Dokdonia sp. MED134 TaxID=313590 RepID=UPI0000689BFD|nr:ABC transporter ATP-binding protein [Dokdonia sp. MED134]EAQ38414.1 lipid A export ATP-binding/permease protein MsbA [Dokdonia sp. MED134]
MEYFKKIISYAMPYKGYGILNIICNVFYALFSTLGFVALIPMLQVLFDKTKTVTEKPEWNGLLKAKDFMEDSLGYYVTEIAKDDKVQALTLMIGFVIAVFLLKNLFGYLAMYFITFLRNGVLMDIRNAMYEKIVSLPVAYFTEKRKGDTIARVTSDVQEVQHSFLSILELIVREPLTITFALGTMFLLSPQLAVFVLTFIPIMGFVISLIGKRLKRKSDRVQREQGEILSKLEETLGGLKIIKSFNAEDRFQNSFNTSTKRFNDYANSLMQRQALASPTSEFLGIVVIGVLLWFGGNMVLTEETLDGPTFIAFMGLAYGILTPAKAFSKASYSVKRGNASAQRILEILETENTITNKDITTPVEGFAKAIAINNISFKYEEQLVLKNFTLNVPKGKTVALVGQSGSGKSTIANLLTRFYDVVSGDITVDGVDIRDMSLKDLRKNIGIVTQDAILFNDSLRNNMIVGKATATDEEIIESLKIANAWEFVKELPEGLDTNIGDSGNKLSGGQKQRLSIARAVLKNPPIMILDEATSALDTESERLVQKALENMMKNRTSIVIAHRLSTIQNADEIVVMQKGEIVEQGKHQELIDQKGMYHKLVSMQSFEE